jgi:hypothetical protein
VWLSGTINQIDHTSVSDFFGKQEIDAACGERAAAQN